MMKKIVIVVLLVTAFFCAKAQNYNAAIGVRGGASQAITLKTFVSGATAFDLMLGTHRGGLNFTALYEIHQDDIFDIDNLTFFYGLGGHVGIYNTNSWPNNWNSSNYSSGPIVGVDGVVGVGYTFDEIPLNLSLDIVPSFHVFPFFGYWQRGSISIRYVFK